MLGSSGELSIRDEAQSIGKNFMSRIDSHFRSSSPFLTWMTKQLPSLLEALQFIGMGKNENNCTFDVLQNFGVSFQHNLKVFRMRSCKLDDNNMLETILFEISSRFPNITSLYLWINKIQSNHPVRRWQTQKRQDVFCLKIDPSRSLTLSEMPLWKRWKRIARKRQPFGVFFLQTFNTVCNAILQGLRDIMMMIM